ncbi:hypothetical protein L2821_02630 [Lactobacillus gasseri]|nr:hypothetical protein [Lactobacillus gasseri]MCZ3526244.1 hypothetical protein [Lactobacillus gasseri]MCZ3553940.1 hypothetical protein [Lactobacillus gasseri]MCZ3581080.1 hypothetical protein [Lactobacillus gasseri]MCZ3582866.1 hypothetical protein [Lactobacillus gasseri]MCZ3584653.1 hypothetical protein [Lactobacillus gasseri]
MITITDQAKFKANDFFNYLNMQLTQAIKKSVAMTYQAKSLQELPTSKEM